jgi:putative membrane protein
VRFIGVILFQICTNAFAILAAANFVSGFSFTGNFPQLVLAACLLTLINALILPILKLIFGPIVLITLGIFTIVINAFGLFILDKFSTPLTIEGILPLVYGTLVIGLVNLIINFGAKKMHKN